MSRHGAWGGWYPPRRARRAAPEHGIRVKKVGATWWGRLWVEALERMSSGYSNRLARGGTYARTGRVHDLEISAGRVTARVTGSRVYRVTLTIAPLSDAAWDAATRALAAQAVFAAKLLAGEMPQEVDAAFAAADASLFPARAKDLATDCSCPDYANPCKHVAAVHYVLGDAFDRDPFLLFELRGRTKDRVLGELRRLRAGDERGDESRGAATTTGAGAPFETMAFAPHVEADYERARGDLAGLSLRPEAPAAHATVVRALGPPPRWSLDEPLADLLTPAYAAASALARRLLLAEAEAGDEPA